MCGEGMGCVGLVGTVPAAGSEGAYTCWEVASGGGGGGGALRRAAWGVGRRARGRALGNAFSRRRLPLTVVNWGSMFLSPIVSSQFLSLCNCCFPSN